MQVFSRKDTLHAPNFKNVGEHLIHSVDKQDEGAASPAPMSPSPNEGLSHKHPYNKFAYLCVCVYIYIYIYINDV